MKGLLDIDGPVMRLITKLVYSVWLNILRIICCLSIVTVGDSVTALFYVPLKVILAAAYALRKRAALVPVLLLLLGSLAGCGSNPQKEASGVEGPTNTYTPSVNEDGYIVITMPKTLLGGKTAEELEAEDKASRAEITDEETLKKTVYSALLANEDGTFSYYLTPEQYPRFQSGLYWLGCLRDPYTAEISQEFVTEADYTDIDENGIPWGLPYR